MERLLRPTEAAEILGLSDSSIYRWLNIGKLQGVRLAGVVRIFYSSVLQQFLQCDGSPERLMLPSQAAEVLGMSRSSIYRRFWEGKLRGVKLAGGPVRIFESAVYGTNNTPPERVFSA
jgi:excisionase family DNA binding protein